MDSKKLQEKQVSDVNIIEDDDNFTAKKHPAEDAQVFYHPEESSPNGKAPSALA
jgi:hypothetical protein